MLNPNSIVSILLGKGYADNFSAMFIPVTQSHKNVYILRFYLLKIQNSKYI